MPTQRCSVCGVLIKFKPESAGKRVKCPKCGSPILLANSVSLETPPTLHEERAPAGARKLERVRQDYRARASHSVNRKKTATKRIFLIGGGTIVLAFFLGLFVGWDHENNSKHTARDKSTSPNEDRGETYRDFEASLATLDLGKPNRPAITLHEAARQGNIDQIKSHLYWGCDVNWPDGAQMTPLCYAAREGRTKVILILMWKGADVNKGTRMGETPLYWAIRNSRKDAVRILLERGGVVRDGLSPWLTLPPWTRSAAWEMVEDKQQTWAARGIVPPITTLHWAAAIGDREIVQTVLAHGLDINGRDADGWSVLHWAVKGAGSPIGVNLETLNLLVSSGADVDAKDDEDYTPLFLAVREEATKVVRLLVTAGANANATIPKGFSIGSPEYEMGKRKLFLSGEGHLSPWLQNCEGNVLHFAVNLGKKDVVEAMLKPGTDANVRDGGGWTALHRAACHDDGPMVDALLGAGADAKLRDHGDRTPFQLALEFQAKHALDVFRRYGIEE